MDYRKIIEATMTERDKEELKRIFIPTKVSYAPEDAFKFVCVEDDGEIRCYGSRALDPRDDKSPREEIYLSSRDGGLSWKTYKADPKALGPAAKSPYSNRRICVKFEEEGEGAYICVAENGGADTRDYKKIPLPVSLFADKQPIALRGKKRWIYAGDFRDGRHHTGVYLSDDDGDTWRFVQVEPSDPFVMEYPHKSMRWENSGCEATVIELTDGTLLMHLRTSTDYHYMSKSYDFGDTWTKPEPTSFHSTLTNPELLRLHDGRTLFFYNNTRPLPEMDKTNVFPPLDMDEQKGVWEDVFTNRDANCIAISEDDCKTWFGFRELYLNPFRNHSDFRSLGSCNCGQDKSVHQFQAIELPFNKVLVHVGQHECLASLVIFDVDWLYETSRKEDFHFGYENLSTHVYIKSVSGNRHKFFPGHCAWNRTDGASPVPDPKGDRSEVMCLRNVEDSRLVSGYQGVVWNFPALKQGKFTVRLWVRGKGVRIGLLDHWMNPIDEYVPLYAAYTCEVTDTGNDWCDLEILYNTEKRTADVLIDGKKVKELAIPEKVNVPNGLCYMHIQTLTDKGDEEGTIIKYFTSEKI